MKMNRSQLIYVENISPTSSEQNLQSYLEKFAPVQAVYFLREKQCTKRSIAGFLRVANGVDRDIIMLRNQQNYRGKRLFMLEADRPHDYQADHTIIVRNITGKISEEVLFEHFEECGKIAFLQIRTDDFAYVAFEDKTSVRLAMAKNNQPLKGSSLKIQLLTRNLDIMIVNLDTLASRMPELYRKMIQPVEPRAPTAQQQQPPNQQPAAQPQQAVAVQPKPQQQQPMQQQQPRQQQQQQQQRQNQPQQQQQRQNQQQQQIQQQRLQQQQQILQQSKPLPQRQQQQQAQQQQLQQKQTQLSQQIQQLKEKANALAEKQQQQQQSQAPQQQDYSDDVQIVETMETSEIIEDDDDADVMIVEKPLVEPIPSEYEPKPNDVMRPVRASELVLKDVAKLKNEDDRRAVWVNNIQPETRRIDLVLYMEQFGDVVVCKIGNSNNCSFTRWAKVLFTTEDAAQRAAEYFLHPFQGRYLFVLHSAKCVGEEPGKVFVIDYLSKYIVFEEVAKVFKHVGELFYMVRLYDNNYKVRLFFVDKVNEDAVLAVQSIGGHPVKIEPYVENMVLKLPKTLAKELKDARELLDPEKEARLAKIEEIHKKEAVDRYAPREYTNPDPKTSAVEIVIYNVPMGTTDQQIRRYFKSIGEPTAIRREAIETETHQVREVESVYVGFRTLSMAMQAAEISPERTLNSYNPFIFTAWTQANMNEKNTLRLFFNKFISIQDIYNGLIHCGPIIFIEKQRAKRALIVFRNGEQGVENAKAMNFIGDTKITCKGEFLATRLDMHAEKKAKQAQKAGANQPAIVIDDEDEVVVVPSNKSPDKKNQMGQQQQPLSKKQQRLQQRQQRQQQQQQQRQQPQQQQQQQQRQQPQQQQRQQPQQQQPRPDFNRNNNRNSNSFNDGGPPQRQQHQFQQRNQRPPWQNNNQGMTSQQQFEQFQPNNQFQQPDDQFGFQQNQNQFRSNDRFNPNGGGPFDRVGNQGGPNMNMNQFEQMMMAQQFDNFNLDNNNGFNRGNNPMESDDPPLQQQQGWGQQQQHFNQFNPPHQRSPFGRGGGGGFPDDRHNDDDQGFGRDSPGIPSNIPDDQIDEYIMRKQEAIKRRLEQLDKQLITSVETSRQRDFEPFSRRRQQGTVFSDNGDVHYVPNPVAVARNRGRRGGGFGGGGGRGGRDGHGEGFSGHNQEQNQSRGGRARRERDELMRARARDPFADVDIVPIIRISEDRSPSPKRSREDEFDTAQFDAAWN